MLLVTLTLAIFLCFLAIILIVFLYFNFTLSFLYAPFIPSKQRRVDEVLISAKLKKGMKLVDLGSGDGRIVLQAVKEFGVLGIGVEANALLMMYSRICAYFSHLKNATFITGDLYQYPLSDCDVVYLFLLPRMLRKVEDKIKKECKPGTLIIAHGFALPGLKLDRTLTSDSLSTFFYQL